MKKRLITLFLSVNMIVNLISVFPNMTKKVIAAEEELLIEVPVDISSRFNSNVYLSEGEIGTDAAVRPNFFISKTGDTPFALNKDKLKEYIDENGYTKTGTKYYINLNDPDKNAIHANMAGKGDPVPPKGYYVGYKVLATSAKRDTSNNGVIYVGVPTKNVPNRSPRHDVWGHNDSGAPTPYMTLGTVGINDGVVSDVGGNVYEIEKMIPANSGDSEDEKKYGIMPTKISFYSESPSTVRILAFTLLTSEAGARKKIEEDIAAYFEKAEPTDEDAQKIIDYLKLVEEQGLDTSSFEGVSKFKSMQEEYCLSVDISDSFNSKIYLSSDNVTGEAESQYPHYFANKSEQKALYAINKDSLKSYVIDGKIKYGNSEYLMPMPEKDVGAINCVPYLSINLPAIYANQYRFLAVSNTDNSYNDTLYMAVKYEDGTSTAAKAVRIKPYNSTDTAGLVATAEMIPLDNGVGNRNINIYEYSVIIPNSFKKVSRLSVSHGGNVSDSGVRILALSLIGMGNTAIDEQVTEILKNLPEIEKIGVGDAYILEKARPLIEAMEERGINGNLPGYKKYKQATEKLDSLMNNEEIVIYVGNNGNDTGSATKDEPIKTLSRAKEIVRALKKNYPEKSYRVKFFGGEYAFEETVSFDAEDSGTIDKPIIYEAEEGETVIFKGSKELDVNGFRSITDENISDRLKPEIRERVLELDLTECGITEIAAFKNSGFDEASQEYAGLYLNGRKQRVAEYPNGNGVYSRWEEISEKGGSDYSSGAGGKIKVSEERIGNWQNAEDIWIGGYFSYDYRYERINVESIDKENNAIKFRNASGSGITNKESKRWKAFNVFEEIDVPGEWYIDRNTMKLYYYPPYDIKDSRLTLSCLNSAFITMAGTENIIIKGITFSETKGSCVVLNAETKNVDIIGCTFKNTEKCGIKMNGSKTGSFESSYNYIDAPSEVEIRDCDFYEIGAHAIFVVGGGNRETLTPGNNKVINNYIEKASQNARGIPAINLRGGVGNSVENNSIKNTPFHAINFFGNDHKIMYNEITNACNEATDAAVIYTGRSYVMRGSEVAYNYIHDFRVKDKKIPLEQTSAIYLDDMMSGVNVHHNIIVNGQTGIHVSGGRDNKIENNILIGLDRVFYTGNPGDDKNNLGSLPDTAKYVYQNYYSVWKKYSDLFQTVLNPGPPAKNVFRYNVSDREQNIIDRMISLGTVTKNVVTKEDVFVDRDNSDYRIKSDSEILKTAPNILTETNFNMSKIGLQVSDIRKSINLSSDSEGDFKKLYPTDNEKNVNPYNYTFSWEEEIYADRYKLVIATDKELKNVVFEKEIFENTYTMNGLDGSAGKYYWQVYALNNLGNMDSEWQADHVYSFETKKEWIYESESAPSLAVDISGYCNAKGFLAEGEKDLNPAEGMYDLEKSLAMNETTLITELKNNGNALRCGGVIYKFPQINNEYKVINTKLAESVEIALSGEEALGVTFLANGIDAVYDYPVRVYYTDGSYEEVILDIGGYGKTSNSNGARFSPELKLGTVSTETGEADAIGGNIYKYDIPTNPDKKLSKIVFDTNSEVQIFAVTEKALSRRMTDDGRIQYNIMINSNIGKNIQAISAVYDEDDRLKATKINSIELSEDKNERLIKVLTPGIDDIDCKEIKIYIRDSLSGAKPYAHEIIKGVE